MYNTVNIQYSINSIMCQIFDGISNLLINVDIY